MTENPMDGVVLQYRAEAFGSFFALDCRLTGDDDHDRTAIRAAGQLMLYEIGRRAGAVNAPQA